MFESSAGMRHEDVPNGWSSFGSASILGRSGVDVKSIWGRFGVELRLSRGGIWVDPGSNQRRFGGRRGVDSGSIEGRFGIDSRSAWSRDGGSIFGGSTQGSILGRFWGSSFGVRTLGSGLCARLWGRLYRIELEPIWGRIRARCWRGIPRSSPASLREATPRRTSKRCGTWAGAPSATCSSPVTSATAARCAR